MNFSSATDNPCCAPHDYEPYTSEWWECVDAQASDDDGFYEDEREYYTADEVVDLRGGATSDYEWYGGYID